MISKANWNQVSNNFYARISPHISANRCGIQKLDSNTRTIGYHEFKTRKSTSDSRCTVYSIVLHTRVSTATMDAGLYWYRMQLVVSSRTGRVSVIWTPQQYVKLDVRFFYACIYSQCSENSRNRVHLYAPELTRAFDTTHTSTTDGTISRLRFRKHQSVCRPVLSEICRRNCG